MNNNVNSIITIIEKGELTSKQIMEKYNISSYRFYKIIHEYGLKTKRLKSGPKHPTGPKKTKFKESLFGTEEEQLEAKIIPSTLDINEFIKDNKNKRTISELMSKYHLTLYQVRELRIQHNLNKSTTSIDKVIVNYSTRMSHKDNVQQIIDTIEKKELYTKQIMEKYNISAYHLNKIIHEYGLEPKKLKPGPRKGTSSKKVPKNTKFKQLLYGTEEEQKESQILPKEFVINDFITDSKNGMVIESLMSKYNLTLYQIRELRKKYELKKR